MISPKLNFIVRVFLLVFVSFLVKDGFSQCNPPDQLPTITCEEAPLICLEDACYETLNNPFNCCNGWCGANTAIHNPEYFQFLATDMCVQIDIHVDGCTTGNGLQSAILDACPWDNSNVVSCDPGTPPGGTMNLSGCNFIPGNTYWLVIDGSSGATCDYTITNTDGIYSPGLTEELMSGEAIPDVVCQGYNSLFLTVDPPIANAHGYYWVLEWTGDTITSTLTNTIVDVPEDVPPGVYEICVRAFSGCDTTENELCFEVEFYEIPPEEKDPEIFCPELFPFYWHTVLIGGEGEYNYTYIDADGCKHDSTWMVESYPEPDLGQVDTLHCLPLGENTFYYEGEPYDQAGTYDLSYPNGDINGCDSMAELNLFLIGIDVIVELTCENGEFVITAFNQELIPFNADVEYNWYEQGGSTLIAEGNPFLTLQPGCYDLWVKVITTEGTCEYFIQTFCFNGDDYYPPPPVLANGDTLLCAQEGIFFYVIPDPDGEQFLEYVWSAPFDVPVFQDGSETVEMDFSNSAGGQVCVYAIGECGPGSSTCFEVTMIDAPEADFIVNPAPLCVNEMTTVTFTGAASANPQVIWDFSTPTTLTGSGFGPYTMSWATPGDKLISLTVIEPGCDTAFKTMVVTVDQLETPVINCTSTINSITFDWNDIAGSTGYLVSFNGGAAVPISSSDTTLTGLTPGTDIELVLTAISGGACPNTTATMECTAEDCPPPTILLSGQDSACLNNPTIIDLEALVNGSPGTGTWSGPGIIDAAEGLFDPKVAGPGQHPLLYAVDLGGCPFNASYSIVVFDSITADFALDPLICISDVANLQYAGNGAGSAAYNYDFGTATVVAGTGVGPYQLSWNTPGQKTVRLQVSENGCMSDIITHTTDVVSSLVAPVVPCAPNTSGVVFSWTLDPAATNSMVNVLSGHSGTLNGNTYTFTGLTPGDIVEIEIISVSGGPCPSRRDTFECEARQCPMPVIAVTPVNDICLYPGTGVVDLQVSITNGNGVGDWSGPGVTDIVNGTFDPVAAAAGSHLITYHYLEDGCDFYETITINVYDVPTAFISNTDLVITCTSGSIVLDGSGSTGTPLIYQWTTDGFINGPTDGPTAVAEQPGTYKLVVSNVASGCKDSTSVVVTQDAGIPTADAGIDRTLTCAETEFTIGGVSTTGINITYNWTTAGGNFTGPTNAQTATANRVGAYTLTVRDTLTGCESNDQMMVGIDTVVASINLVAGDTIDCNTTISTASGTLNEPLADYTLLWSTSDGLIVGDSTGTSIDVSQGGTYTLTIVNKRNGCETSEDVVVAESDEIIDAVNVLQTNVTCYGDDDGSLTVESVEGGGPDYEYLWSIGATATSLTLLSPGIYELTVTDQNGCSFEKSFTITEPDLVTVDVGPNLTVAAGDSVRIDLLTNVPANAIGTIDWGGYDGIFCPGCPSFQFIATTSATISASVADTAGCTAFDSLRLTVIVPRIIFIPNIFSPNGDGINDYFTISGRFNLTEITKLRIYDRWGNQLFEKLEFMPGEQGEGWDGTFKEEPMQPGVYVFVADLLYEDGITETVSGNITLVR